MQRQGRAKQPEAPNWTPSPDAQRKPLWQRRHLVDSTSRGRHRQPSDLGARPRDFVRNRPVAVAHSVVLDGDFVWYICTKSGLLSRLSFVLEANRPSSRRYCRVCAVLTSSCRRIVLTNTGGLRLLTITAAEGRSGAVSGTFMASEIAEAGAVVRRQLAANAASTAELAAGLRARKPPFVVTIARGSSDHAALYLKHLIELKVALACASLGPSIASLYHAPLRLADAVAIAISAVGPEPGHRRDAARGEGRARRDDRARQRRGLSARPRCRGAGALARGRTALGSGDKVDDRLARRRRLSCRPLERRPRTPRRARETAFGSRLFERRAALVDRRSRRWPKPPRCSSSVAARLSPSRPRRRSSSRKPRRFTRKRSLPPRCCTGRRGSSGRDFRFSPSRPRTPPAKGFSRPSTVSPHRRDAAPRRLRAARAL